VAGVSAPTHPSESAPTRSTPLPGPLRLFRVVAVAEAITWGLLLLGMVLKYVTETTELGVRVFGMLHGIVFIAYCLTTVIVGLDQRWPLRRTVVGLLCSIPPFVTIVFDRWAERRGALGTTWRLVGTEPTTPLERPVAWLLRHPGRGLLVAVVAVAVLTAVALVVGPPASG